MRSLKLKLPVPPEADWTQLSAFGEDLHHYARNEVLAVDGSQSTNGERVADLARLGYLPEPVLDPTLGYGGMWTKHRPVDLVTCDINPDRGPDFVADFTALPFGRDEFASCLYDPPYRFAGTPTDTDDGGHDDLYGTHIYRTKEQQLTLILDGAKECARVTRDVLIVKCQDQVVAGSTFFQTTAVADCLRLQGWELKDRLLLISYRAQPAGRSQRNARNNFSTFMVFVPAGELDDRGRR